jgi:hypothetical protein
MTKYEGQAIFVPGKRKHRANKGRQHMRASSERQCGIERQAEEGEQRRASRQRQQKRAGRRRANRGGQSEESKQRRTSKEKKEKKGHA